MINLLPPQEQEGLSHAKRQKITIILGIVFLAFFVCFSLVLFMVNVRLGGKISAEKILLDDSKGGLGSPSSVDLKKQLEYYNKNLTAMTVLYQGRPYINEVIQELAGLLPPEVYLTGFSYNKESLQVRLTGFAPTGEALQTLKNNLGQQADFYDISFPPSNWVKLTDIDFALSFKIRAPSVK